MKEKASFFECMSTNFKPAYNQCFILFLYFFVKQPCQTIEINSMFSSYLANWRAGHSYMQMQKYRCSFPGCIGIFLVGEGPNPLEDPYLEIRGCAFVSNASRFDFSEIIGNRVMRLNRNPLSFRMFSHKYPHQCQGYSQCQSVSYFPTRLAFHSHQSSGSFRRLHGMRLLFSSDPAQSK